MISLMCLPMAINKEPKVTSLFMTIHKETHVYINIVNKMLNLYVNAFNDVMLTNTSRLWPGIMKVSLAER